MNRADQHLKEGHEAAQRERERELEKLAGHTCRLAPQLRLDLLTEGGRARAAQAIADRLPWKMTVAVVREVYRSEGRPVPSIAEVDAWLGEEVPSLPEKS